MNDDDFPNPFESADASIKSEGPKPFTLWRPSQFLQYTAPEGAVILGDHLLELGKWMSVLGVGGLGKTRIILYLAICQILLRLA